jgi:hypothetical protein
LFSVRELAAVGLFCSQQFPGAYRIGGSRRMAIEKERRSFACGDDASARRANTCPTAPSAGFSETL